MWCIRCDTIPGVSKKAQETKLENMVLRVSACSTSQVMWSLRQPGLIARSEYTRKPTNCGLPMCQTNLIFQPQTQCAFIDWLPTILVHLQQPCAQRGKYGVSREVGDWSYVNLKPTHNFPIPLNTRSSSIYHRLVIKFNMAPKSGGYFIYTPWVYLALFSHNTQHGRRQNER